MANITGTEIRDRLRSLTTVDVSDTTLASAAFIPAGDAWINKVLSNNSAGTFAALSSDDKALAKAAEIAYVASKVVSNAPLEDHEAGPIKIKGISADKIKAICDLLKQEWLDAFDLLGYTTQTIYIGSKEDSLYGSEDTIYE